MHEENLEECLRLVEEDKDDKWKSWKTKKKSIRLAKFTTQF